MERPPVDIPGCQKRGDKGYPLSHVEGEKVSGVGESCGRTKPRGPYEVRGRFRAARVERKGRPPRRARDVTPGESRAHFRLRASFFPLFTQPCGKYSEVLCPRGRTVLGLGLVIEVDVGLEPENSATFPSLRW